MYREILEHFDEHSIPDLDVAVLSALELFERTIFPAFPLGTLKKPLVLGSGNAGVVGKRLFGNQDAYFADESTFEYVLAMHDDHITSAVLISASGGKDAVHIAQRLREKQIPLWLLTNNENAPAGGFVEPAHIVVFPKNREPYTYNVSTYMGMILSKTHENPVAIKHFITDVVDTRIPNTLAQYNAFYLILPPQLIPMKDMFSSKFDELFGSRVSARVFTLEQSKHAKTVVPSDTEAFISFGEENSTFGNEKTRFHIPLPENAGYAAMMAIGYFVIGQIQKQHRPYFKDNIKEYTKKASEIFRETISVIVE